MGCCSSPEEVEEVEEEYKKMSTETYILGMVAFLSVAFYFLDRRVRNLEHDLVLIVEMLLISKKLPDPEKK